MNRSSRAASRTPPPSRPSTSITSGASRSTSCAACSILRSFDLTAETFALALERRRQFRGDSAQKEQGWLFAIARSLLHAYWRKGRIERATVARLGIERPSLGTEDIEYLHRQAGIETLRVRVAEALDAVRPEQAAAIRARVLEERDYAEIAAEFETTPDVIRARLSRGLKMLRGLLGNKVEDVLADA